jgi:hypothetical protein
LANYFPKHTVTARVQEPTAFRRLSLSLVEMALITGVLVRVFRSLMLTHGSSSILYVGTMLTVGMLFIIGMLTAHLANFPLHHWFWRAPAFVAVEVASEMATSLFLIWLAREPNGTVRAHFSDWFGMSTMTLLTRGLAVVLWTLLLAAIVSVVRTRLVKEEADDPLPAE